MSLFCRLLSVGGSAPAHDGGALVYVAFQNLVPAYYAFSVLIEESLHAVGEVALQRLCCQSVLLSHCLAFRTFCPTLCRRFVASDMDKFGWENVREFFQHVLAESINLLVAEAEHVQIDAPSVSHLVRTARTSELGIGGESSLHVSWHVNLGDDGDVSLACVLHYFASLILSVESAVFSLVVHHRVESHDGARTLRSYARKTRILLYLDSPSLVVGEMPVKDVHVVHSHEVEIFLDEVHGEEVARAVEHHAAITEAWLVCYSYRT